METKMQNPTYLKKSALFFALVMITTHAWSFGGGDARSSAHCEEPKFKNMKPPKVIAPAGEFSFTASSNTVPDSIQVVIKGQKIQANVRDHYGFQVKGNMPAELTDGYALIKISAHSKPASCIGEASWLVKIVAPE